MKKIKNKKRRTLFFLTTNRINEALELYKMGADYVIVPHFLGGDKASFLLQEFMQRDIKDIRKQRKTHVEELKEYKKLGQMYM
jgi:hypothetical protein